MSSNAKARYAEGLSKGARPVLGELDSMRVFVQGEGSRLMRFELVVRVLTASCWISRFQGAGTEVGIVPLFGKVGDDGRVPFEGDLFVE